VYTAWVTAADQQTVAVMAAKTFLRLIHNKL